MAVEIKGGAKFEHGSPKPLFDMHISRFALYDVSKDGRFLVPVSPAAEQGGSVPITVVVNWTAGLKK